MEIVFGIIMVVGAGYLVLMILGGVNELFDIGIDGAMESLGLNAVFGVDTGAADAAGLGCSVLAAFLAGFGALGLVGTLNDWNLLLTLLLSVAFGWMLGRLAVWFMRFVLAQEGTNVYSDEDMIGKIARVTIDTPAGKTGEAMLEDGQVLKYAIREINDAALERGDQVEVVDVTGTVLRVKRKRT